MTFFRVRLAAGLVAVAAVSLAACSSSGPSSSGGGGGGGSSSSSGSPAAKQETFGISMCYLNNPAEQVFVTAEKAAAKAAGWKVLQPTNANNSQAQQITDVTNLINQGITVLDLHECSASGALPAITAANKKGIPVFLPDEAAEKGDVAITVQIDNTDAAKVVCQTFVSDLKAANRPLTGSVIQLQGDIASSTGQQRTSGFVDCLKTMAPGIKVLTVPTAWDATAGAKGLTTLLNANKDVVGIYMQSDIVFGAGTRQVLKQKNLLTPTSDPKHIMVFGIDGGCNALQQINAGDIDFTSSSPLNQYGTAAIPFLKLALANKLDTIQPGTKSTLPGSEGQQINKIATGLQLILPDTIVAKANVADPKLWANSLGCKL